MANTEFKTRILLKGDTHENWQTANPVLLANEVAVVHEQNETLFKVGNGTAHYNDLPFVSAKAANVSDWALAKNKPTYSADEITGLEEFITNNVPAAVDYTVTVTESTPKGYAKAYTLTQQGTEIGVINIPKDMVVSSGTVATYTAEDAPEGVTAGTYLVLTLANATSDKVYINVGDLIEYVTSGSADTDQIKIAVSADHKVTATLKAGSITKDQLSNELKTAVDNSGSALQPSDITTGTNVGTIKVGETQVAIAGLGSAAYEDRTKFANAADLATVATTGKIDDLTQEATGYIVLNCGSATNVI